MEERQISSVDLGVGVEYYWPDCTRNPIGYIFHLDSSIDLCWLGWKDGQEGDLSEMQPGESLSLKITAPEKIMVAVDTAAKAHCLAPEGAEAVTMTARVCWVHKYPRVQVIQCICLESKLLKWYTAELSLRYTAPYEPELKLKEMLTPPPAEVPTGNMEEALRKCFEELNSNLHKPPES